VFGGRLLPGVSHPTNVPTQIEQLIQTRNAVADLRAIRIPAVI
jgi:hypothetical protein